MTFRCRHCGELVPDKRHLQLCERCRNEPQPNLLDDFLIGISIRNTVRESTRQSCWPLELVRIVPRTVSTPLTNPAGPATPAAVLHRRA